MAKKKATKETTKHVPQMDAFVLVQSNWQYDDEYNYRDDESSGTPTKVFLNQEKAEDECFKLNKAQLLSKGLSGYRGHTEGEECKGDLKAIGVKFKDEESMQVSDKNSDELIKRVIEITGVDWYQVHPVKLDIGKTIQE